MLTKVDKTLTARVAEGLGIQVPQPEQNLNQNIPADGDPKDYQSINVHSELKFSKALSMADTVKDTIKTRQVAILAADGVEESSLIAMKKALEAAGAYLMDLTAAGTKIRSENKTEKEHMAYGILLNRNSKEFINAIAQHRFREREKAGNVLV